MFPIFSKNLAMLMSPPKSEGVEACVRRKSKDFFDYRANCSGNSKADFSTCSRKNEKPVRSV